MIGIYKQTEGGKTSVTENNEDSCWKKKNSNVIFKYDYNYDNMLSYSKLYVQFSSVYCYLPPHVKVYGTGLLQ